MVRATEEVAIMVGPFSSDESHSPRAAPEREWAHKRLERKRKLRADLVAYLVINAFLIVVWTLTGAGYFWPGWVLGGWGVFLLLDAWQAYFRRPITEEDIERELRGMH